MFLEIFDNLLKKNQLNKRQFSIKSGIPYTTIDGFYKKGYENIRLTTLRKIADYFGVTLDYLIFGKEPHGGNEQILEMQKHYSMLNEIGKQKALEYIKDLTENIKYTNKQTSTAKQIENDIASEVAKQIKTVKSSV